MGHSTDNKSKIPLDRIVGTMSKIVDPKKMAKSEPFVTPKINGIAPELIETPNSSDLLELTDVSDTELELIPTDTEIL